MKRLLRWLRRWAALLIALFVFEECALTGLETYLSLQPPAISWSFSPTKVMWDYGRGSVCIAIPHEAAGKSVVQLWDGFRHGDKTTLGFGLRIRDGGLPKSYMSVTIIVVPFWFPALISGIAVVMLIKREGFINNWPWRLRRERRGFEPILKSDCSTENPVPSPRRGEG